MTVLYGQFRNEEQYDIGTDDGDSIQNIPWSWAKPGQHRLGFEILF